MTDLVEIEPGRWRVKRERGPVARSTLAFPMVISDEMEPVEQVDGRFYTSKSEFRKVGRSLGLVEVGNEKPKPKRTRKADDPVVRKQRRDSLGRAIARYRAGERVRA